MSRMREIIEKKRGIKASDEIQHNDCGCSATGSNKLGVIVIGQKTIPDVFGPAEGFVSNNPDSSREPFLKVERSTKNLIEEILETKKRR